MESLVLSLSHCPFLNPFRLLLSLANPGFIQPFLTIARQSGFGVITVLKKDNNEPLKEALVRWQGQPTDKVIDDEHKHEQVELWDCPGLETLETYDGAIRVVRGVVHNLSDGTVHTWCLGVTGCATRLSAQKVLEVGRGRWHIENTAFHQFTHCWCFDHVFTHGADAIPALFFIFILAFNLLQLFLYGSSAATAATAARMSPKPSRAWSTR